MGNNYDKIVKQNLARLFSEEPPKLEARLPGRREKSAFVFRAFGGECRLQPDGILINGERRSDAVGILISLYALNASEENCRTEPFRAFKEFPDSGPYAGAFFTHAEQILTQAVSVVKAARGEIVRRLQGGDAPASVGGDFSFTVAPLPKIALCYIFYEADEDFPASATCLFSNNADRFMPLDGLADVGEYTSRTILDIAASNPSG